MEQSALDRQAARPTLGNKNRRAGAASTAHHANPSCMRKFLSDTIGTVRALRLARDNMVAAWPISFYRREFIAENILGRRLFSSGFVFSAISPAFTPAIIVFNFA